jgi:hypothetical protein
MMPCRAFGEDAALASGVVAGEARNTEMKGNRMLAPKQDTNSSVLWDKRFNLARHAAAWSSNQAWLVMMIVPLAANIPPTPWHTETFAPGTCAGAVPRIWRTLSCNANIPYMPVWV